MGRPTGGSGHSHSSHRGSGHRHSSSSRPSSRHSSNYSRDYSYRIFGRTCSVRYRSSSTSFSGFMTTIVFVAIMFFISAASNTIPKSTYPREKLTSVAPYISDCITDELGWIEDKRYVENELKAVYDKTGMQPYVYFLEYNDSLSTDKQKEEWAGEHFDENNLGSNAIVFYYFGERNESDVGYMYLCFGNDSAVIMDSEACDIFWAYLDACWDEEAVTTDQLIITSFCKTASRIMTKTKTFGDYIIPLIASVVIIVVSIVIYLIIVKMVKDRQNKRESDERILKTDIGRMDSNVDDLIDRNQ